MDQWRGVDQWCRMDQRGGVDHGSSSVGNGTNSNLGNMTDMLLAHNSVKSVLIIRGVVDSALGAIRVHHGVGAANGIAIAGLVLRLSIACDTVLYVVRKAVLRVSVNLFDDLWDDFSDGCGVGGVSRCVDEVCGRGVHHGSRSVCDRARVRGVGCGGDDARLCGRNGAYQYYQLKTKKKLMLVLY